jgi:RNA polymerase sigma-70 factor (ECF subfamily)
LAASERARRRFQTVAPPHLDAAYSLAKALTGSGADAEDVVQDACVRALAALETREIAHPRAWFLTLTRNCALTLLSRRRPEVLADDIGDLERAGALAACDRAPNAEQAAIAADDSARLKTCFAALPLVLREALALRVLHGLAYREIAAALAAPVGTVMSRLARARSGLAACMGEKP